MQDLAQRITRLRQAIGLSSERLAQQLDVSHKTVINWEKDRGDPSLANLLKIAEHFGVTPDYLLGATSESFDEAAVEDDQRRADRRQTPTRRKQTCRP